MASYQTYIDLTLTDANGDTAKMSVPSGYVADTQTLAVSAALIAGLLTALGAPGVITNAKVTSANFRFLYEKASPSGAIDAEYSAVQDAARMNFLNSAGSRGLLSVPAPIPTVFGPVPNEDVVDPAGPIAPLISWYVAHAETAAGLLNVYNGGVKIAKHAPRRAQHKVA